MSRRSMDTASNHGERQTGDADDLMKEPWFPLGAMPVPSLRGAAPESAKGRDVAISCCALQLRDSHVASLPGMTDARTLSREKRTGTRSYDHLLKGDSFR